MKWGREMVRVARCARVSSATGFNRVFWRREDVQPPQRLPSAGVKPLKRFHPSASAPTRLKPGANENEAGFLHASCQPGGLPELSRGQRPRTKAPISFRPSGAAEYLPAPLRGARLNKTDIRGRCPRLGSVGPSGHGKPTSKLFSLTPSLSRWEREHYRPRAMKPLRPGVQARKNFPPLPAGEGRGEGGQPPSSQIVR